MSPLDNVGCSPEFLCSDAGSSCHPLDVCRHLRPAAPRHGHGVGVVDDPDQHVPLLRLDDLVQLPVVLQHQHLLGRVALLQNEILKSINFNTIVLKSNYKSLIL